MTTSTILNLTNRQIKFIALEVSDLLETGLSVFDPHFADDMSNRTFNWVLSANHKSSCYVMRKCYYEYFNKKAN